MRCFADESAQDPVAGLLSRVLGIDRIYGAVRGRSLWCASLSALSANAGAARNVGAWVGQKMSSFLLPAADQVRRGRMFFAAGTVTSCLRCRTLTTALRAGRRPSSCCRAWTSCIVPAWKAVCVASTLLAWLSSWPWPLQVDVRQTELQVFYELGGELWRFPLLPALLNARTHARTQSPLDGV